MKATLSGLCLASVLLLAGLMPASAPAQTQPGVPCETVVTCPPDFFLTTAAEGATAIFSVTATNPCESDLTIQCYLGAATGIPVTPSTLFPVGSNTVVCIATTRSGVATQCSFRIVVTRDNQAPQLMAPPRIVVPCTGQGGAVVDYPLTVIDDLDPNPSVTCVPPSGSFFLSGSNLVTCTALDAAGNRTVVQFLVLVGGGCDISRCLEITVPADRVVPCLGSGGAIVEFAATARNTCTGAALPVNCTPSSGSLFPVGMTRVFCSVDSGGLKGTASFLVEVTDNQPPVLHCPSNIVVAALSPLGAQVHYSVTATDDCSSRPPRVRCSPESGSVFPVGNTHVYCEAVDESGNSSTCGFLVTVLPPDPFSVTPDGRDGLELRWTGNAVVENTESLGERAVWTDVREVPEQDGDEWVLRLPSSARSHFFRLRVLPVIPPPDRDRDGVPDDVDRCPDTPPGIPVDETGCGGYDMIASPGQALGPDQAALRHLQTQMFRWPGSEALAVLIPVSDDSGTDLVSLLFKRNFSPALAEASRLVVALERALNEVVRARVIRLLEIERTGPDLDEENADMRNEDHEILGFERFEQTLTDSLWKHRQLWLNVSNIVRSIETTQTRERVQIQSMDATRGIAVLADGRQIFLPRPDTDAVQPFASINNALVEGSLVDVTLTPLPDGSIHASTAVAATGVSANVLQQINPRRLGLRVTPADFGLPNYDMAARHELKAYRWGFTENLSRHYLEFNQAFAAIRFISLGSGGNYKHWLTIDSDINNDNIYGTLVSKLDENSPPYVLRSDVLPQYKPFSIRVREIRALIVGTSLGASEIISEEFYVIEVNQTGLYAEAFYDETAFDLQDSPNETGHRVARVTDFARRFPLTLKPINEFTFQGASFKATGNSSSYPSIHSIGLNDPFAVHFQDPNDQLFFANPDDLDKGIYHPTLRGNNNGKPFSYRVSLPFISRDRLHTCSGTNPDTFYKIPLAGVYGISQGNNGQFTHNGWQRYAWDFPKAANTAVLAARGGKVVDMRESSSQSCWDPNAVKPNGKQGDCVNCMGVASPNFVTIRHRDGTYAWYGHFRNNQVFVNLNQRVYRGTALGGVGTTGCSTGNHLHFHVVNPEQTTTIPIRFESFIWPTVTFAPCYLPPSKSAGFSTNQ